MVVTGASGFLGRRVVELLRGGREPLRAMAGSRDGDITDPMSFRDVMTGARCVIHCAGLAHQFGDTDPERFVLVNVRGTRNAVEAAAQAGVRRFVLASSVAVYGRGDNADETTKCLPRSPYGKSKYDAEIEAGSIARRAGMDLVVLRLATLYGPGDPGNIARLIAAIESRRFIWLGGGENRKSILHVDDAARACVEASEADAPAGVFNVVAETVPMSRIVSAIESSLQTRVFPLRVPRVLASALAAIALHVPVGAARRAGQTVTKWLSDEVYDGTKFALAYSFVPSVLTRDGIAAEVAARRS